MTDDEEAAFRHSATVVLAACKVAQQTRSPLKTPPSGDMFLNALRDWLVANDDPRVTPKGITDVVAACGDFAEWLSQRPVRS